MWVRVYVGMMYVSKYVCMCACMHVCLSMCSILQVYVHELMGMYMYMSL